jgi:ABC-type transport system substrate-binding protein
MISVRGIIMRVKKFVLASAFLLLTLTMLSNGIEVKAEQPEWFFTVNMVGPTSNPVRMQFCQLMEKEVQKIGIGAELDLISWAALGPRCTDAEVGMYDEGGYDICFFGMSLGTPAGHPGDSMQGVYGGEAIPPAGFNVMYWSNSTTTEHYMTYRATESDALIQEITTELDLDIAKSLMYDWQKLWYDALPNIIIYNQYEVHAVSAGLYGYDPVGYPLSSITTQWGLDSVVVAASTSGDTFNTMIATDVYDQYSAGPPTSGLFGLTPSKDTVLPSGTNRDTWMTTNFGTTDFLKTYPQSIVEMGTFSDDGLQYNVTLRDDIFFHDGVQADGWDVAFSMQARLVPDCGASVYSNWKVPFGTDDKASHHGNYSCVVEDLDGDGFAGNLSFNMVTTFAPLLTDTLSQLTFFPEHILGDPDTHGFDGSGNFDVTLWQVAPNEWAEHSYNTGRTSDAGGLPGPIGTGAMIFKEYDASAGTITLEKFEDIKWDNASAAWVAAPGNTFCDFLDGKWTDMPESATIIVASMDSALADMKTGEVNIMDPQFTMSNILEELQAEPTITPVLTPETGWQAIYMNPKFVQDGVYHLDKKGVRHAISHMVPREDIITYLMNGLGLPGFTPVPITSWAAIQESDLLTYKKTVVASDGSTTPEENATTAYDEYSLDVAFTWLDTEGYDTTAWREWAVREEETGTTPGFEFLALTLAIAVVGLIARRRRN